MVEIGERVSALEVKVAMFMEQQIAQNDSIIKELHGLRADMAERDKNINRIRNDWLTWVARGVIVFAIGLLTTILGKLNADLTMIMSKLNPQQSQLHGGIKP